MTSETRSTVSRLALTNLRGVAPTIRAGVAMATALCASAACAAAQDPVTDDPFSAIRWRLGDDGRVEIWPVRLQGAADGWGTVGDPIEPLCSPWTSLGLLGRTACLLTGDGDLLATTDTERFFDRLGVDDDGLVRLLGSPPRPDTSRDARLRYRLAIHAAAERGLKPALGPLRRLLRNGSGIDAACLAAAAEAEAVLTGEPRPDTGPRRAVPDVAAFLATVPRDVHVIAVVDQTRVPPPRTLFAIQRALHVMWARNTATSLGVTVPTTRAAETHRSAAGPGLLGYELARRYGDHRILRTCAAVRFRTSAAPGVPSDAWIRARLDGTFDVAALRAGLEADGLDPGSAADTAELRTDTIRLRVAADHAIFEAGIGSGATDLLDETARQRFLTTCRADTAPIQLGSFGLPRYLARTVIGGATPRFTGIVPPRRAGEPLLARLDFQAPAEAESCADWLRSNLEVCGRLAADDALETSLRDAARTLHAEATITVDSDSPTWVSVRAPVPAVELGAFAQFVCARLY